MSFIINPYEFAAVSTDLFADAFDDSSFDTGKWARRHNDANITLTETTHLLFTMAGGNVAVNDAIDSIATINFTNRTMDFYIDTVNGFNGFFFIVGIIADPITNDNVNRASLATFISGNIVTLGQTRIGGSNSNTSNADWSLLGAGGRLQYWRMKHTSSDDKLEYFYSNDGVSYTSLGSYATFDANFGDLTAVHPFIWMTGGGNGSSRDAFIKDLRVY